MGSVAVGPKEESLFLGLWRRETFIRSPAPASVPGGLGWKRRMGNNTATMGPHPTQ